MRHKDDLLPLASIPNKEGFVLIAVHRDGTEARVAVYLNKDGVYVLPDWYNLVGWRRA